MDYFGDISRYFTIESVVEKAPGSYHIYEASAYSRYMVMVAGNSSRAHVTHPHFVTPMVPMSLRDMSRTNVSPVTSIAG